MNWICYCGNMVDGKRFCPRCRRVRFRLERPEFLDYFGPTIGTVTGGYPFNFPADRLEGHVMICGQTGTGKSRLAMNLAVKTKTCLLVVDVEGEWKGIIPYLKGRTEYYDVGSNLRINPFDLNDPGLVRELMRETVFKGIEKEYVDLSAQMNFVLQDAIAESRSMQELIDKIKSYNKQKLTGLDKTKTALLVRLDPFMRSPLKEIFFCKKSNPDLEKLADRNIVIDLHALDAKVAYGKELRLIYNTITTYYLRQMLAREPAGKVSNLFVADEAQLLVPRILQKIVVTESWPATEFATRLRKRGCGLVLITQSPSNIEKDIFKNTATKIAFRLQSQEDIKLIADSAGFSDIAEYEFLAESMVKLARKQAIVCTEGKDPFLIAAADFQPSDFVPVVAPASPEVPDDMRTADLRKEGSHELDSAEKLFMHTVETQPFISVRERRHLLGWENDEYVSVVASLVGKGVIERVQVPKGRGRPLVLYQVKGTNPSVKHEYYVDWIVRQLKQVNIACLASKVGPDVQITSLKTAVNIETGNSEISGNIKSALSTFERIIVCSDDAKVLESVRSQMGKEEAKRVFVCFVWDIPSFFKAEAN